MDLGHPIHGAAQRPLVSVLVPAFNHERFIESALDSVASEGYEPMELLVCDDGSTDGTSTVAASWSQRHRTIDFRLFRHDNVGIGRTFNRLLREARGSYVAPLASDDELVAGGIRRRLRAMTGGIRAVFGDAEAIDGRGRVIHPSVLVNNGVNKRRLQRDVAAEIIFNWGVPGPVLLAETAALREIGGLSEDLIVEDWDLYLRLAARGWLAFEDVVVARYRIHGAGASWLPANWSRMVEDQRRVALRNRHLFHGRHRMLLRFQQLVYTPPWRLLARVVSKGLRLSDRAMSKVVSRRAQGRWKADRP